MLGTTGRRGKKKRSLPWGSLRPSVTIRKDICKHHEERCIRVCNDNYMVVLGIISNSFLENRRFQI